MPNKIQAKAAVDAAAAAIKADIDNILPVGVDIIDGNITFAPTRWGIKLNGVNEASAVTLANTISANLTAASRTHIVERVGRRSTDHSRTVINIGSQLASYQITYS